VDVQGGQRQFALPFPDAGRGVHFLRLKADNASRDVEAWGRLTLLR
jgi:hypothetical protein